VSSFRRIIGSRANAALSTRPLTEAGKRRSSQNAFRHGCRSRSRLVIPEDNPSRQEFDDHLPGFLSCFQPRNPAERACANQMVVAKLPPRNLLAAETRKFTETIAAQSADPRRADQTSITEAFLSLVSVPGFAAVRNLLNLQGQEPDTCLRNLRPKKPNLPPNAESRIKSARSKGNNLLDLPEVIRHT
jgi:hypothetical protein